jgi:hypothetical protein
VGGVSVPSVAVPTGSTPAARTPGVALPSLSTPSGARTRQGSAPGAPTGALAGAAGALASTSSAVAAERATAGLRSAGAASADPARVTGRDAKHAAAVRRDQRLRKDVLRFESCLPNLPKGEKRVLMLRAGVGIDHPRTRAEVKRMTGMSIKRIRRLERRGLHKLRTLGAGGHCGRVATTGLGFVPGGPVAMLPIAAPAASPAGAAVGAPRAEVLGQHASGGSTFTSPAAVPVLHFLDRVRQGNTLDLTMLIVPLALLAFLALVFREARRT